MSEQKSSSTDPLSTDAEEVTSDDNSEGQVEEELNIPDKEFYVEFRVMLKPYPNEHWSDWFLYPSGADLKQMRQALKENKVLFVDSMEEVKEAIKIDTMLNAKFLDLADDVTTVRQNSKQIKNDLGYGLWDKIPARFASAIQVKLIDNDVQNRLKPKTIKDLYEDMTGLSATNDVESDEEEEETLLEEE